MSKAIFSVIFLSGSALAFFAVSHACPSSSPGSISNHVATAEDEDGQKISLDQVPAAARESIKRVAATHAIESVMVEKEMGVTMYEAAWRIDGKLHEVVVSTDGTVVETESEVALADSPSAIQKVATEKMPKGSEIKVTRKEVVVFEIETAVDGKVTEILVSATGIPVEFEVQGDEDHDNDNASAGDDDHDDEQSHDDDDDDADDGN